MTLSGAVNATVPPGGAGVGVGTIVDDDEVPALTVAYGRGAYSVTEGAAVAVTVVLSRPPGRPVTVPLTHMPAGADASDYSGVPGSVRFDASETERTFSVAAANDGMRDGGEQVDLGFGVLPSGVTPRSPRTATITIVDALPAADDRRNPWLRRFGEAAMGHVLDALDERIRCAPVRHPGPARHGAASTRRGCEPREDASMSLVVAGQRVPVLAPPPAATALAGPAQGRPGARRGGDWSWDGWSYRGRDAGAPRRGTAAPRSLTAKEALSRSTFLLLSGSQGGANRLSVWGRGALSRFDDDDGGFALDGDVASVTLGVDYANHRLLAGVALSHSEGDGSYRRDGLGRTADASLTGLYPYLYLGVGEGTAVWGAAGIGSGTLDLAHGGRESSAVGRESGAVGRGASAVGRGASAGVRTRMGAVGVRRDFIGPAESHGVAVALKADALLLRIDSDASGELHATRNAANRQRLAVELSRQLALGGGAWIDPFFEAGVRRDAGDAEAALGAELGGGFRYQLPARGLSAELDARGLFRGSGDSVEELGVSGSLRYDPVTRSSLGPSLSLSVTGGLEGWPGPDDPWGRSALFGRGVDGGEPADLRIDAGFGYGSPVLGGVATGTPWIGATLSEGWRAWRVGYRLAFGSGVTLGLDGRLGEDAAGGRPADYALMLRLSLR